SVSRPLRQDSELPDPPWAASSRDEAEPTAQKARTEPKIRATGSDRLYLRRGGAGIGADPDGALRFGIHCQTRRRPRWQGRRLAGMEPHRVSCRPPVAVDPRVFKGLAVYRVRADALDIRLFQVGPPIRI